MHGAGGDGVNADFEPIGDEVIVDRANIELPIGSGVLADHLLGSLKVGTGIPKVVNAHGCVGANGILLSHLGDSALGVELGVTPLGVRGWEGQNESTQFWSTGALQKLIDVHVHKLVAIGE